MHTGSCLCGQVTYQYDGEIDELSRCYCHQCQKAQGGAFVAVAPVDARRFTLTAGQHCLKTFSASPGKVRAFCGECGSPLYSARDDLPGVIRLRVGTLDTPLAVNRQVHAFTAERPLWYEILDDFPQFPGKRPA